MDSAATSSGFARLAASPSLPEPYGRREATPAGVPAHRGGTLIILLYFRDWGGRAGSEVAQPRSGEAEDNLNPCGLKLFTMNIHVVLRCNVDVINVIIQHLSAVDAYMFRRAIMEERPHRHYGFQRSMWESMNSAQFEWALADNLPKDYHIILPAIIFGRVDLATQWIKCSSRWKTRCALKRIDTKYAKIMMASAIADGNLDTVRALVSVHVPISGATGIPLNILTWRSKQRYPTDWCETPPVKKRRHAPYRIKLRRWNRIMRNLSSDESSSDDDSTDLVSEALVDLPKLVSVEVPVDRRLDPIIMKVNGSANWWMHR